MQAEDSRVVVRDLVDQLVRGHLVQSVEIDVFYRLMLRSLSECLSISLLQWTGIPMLLLQDINVDELVNEQNHLNPIDIISQLPHIANFPKHIPKCLEINPFFYLTLYLSLQIDIALISLKMSLTLSYFLQSLQRVQVVRGMELILHIPAIWLIL